LRFLYADDEDMVVQNTKSGVNAAVKYIFSVLFLFGVVTNAWARQTQMSINGGYGRVTGENEDVRGQFAPIVGASLKLKLHKPEIRIDYEYVP